MPFIEAVAALLLVLGSALVIQAVRAADQAGTERPATAGPREEEASYRKAA